MGCWFYHAYQCTTIHVSVYFEFLRRDWEEGTHDGEGAGKSFLRFIVDCIHYLSFHWLRTLELILEISATYRTDLPVLCKQIID